jgi:thymidylate synthase ThyX
LDYPVESFTDAERALLEPHFTNLDRRVFALVNLPETVKGALFARYSRYPGTLRRLFLDEFASEVPTGGRPFDGAEGERAAGLYERVFIGYGDDSIAQVGGAHLACEWVSNVLTKILQRGRLAAYLEQSTRYIPYDRPMPGRDGAAGAYRYYSDSDLGPGYRRAMDEIFALYSRALEATQAWTAERWPRGEGQPERAWRGSIRAKALDLLRGLLPASTLSHVGIYASGQA